MPDNRSWKKRKPTFCVDLAWARGWWILRINVLHVWIRYQKQRWFFVWPRKLRPSVCEQWHSQGGHGQTSLAPRRRWKLAFVSGFWGLCPQTPTGALSLDDPAGASPRSPVLSPCSKFLATPLSVVKLQGVLNEFTLMRTVQPPSGTKLRTRAI